MKKNKLITIVFTLVAMLTLSFSADAASSKVMWDNMELKKGQIGRVTVLKETNLLLISEFNGEGGSAVRTLKPGEVYRVYSFKTPHGYVPMYAVGDKHYVMKDTDVKYETPSKAKLALVNKK